MRAIKLLAALPFLLVFGVIFTLMGGLKDGSNLTALAAYALTALLFLLIAIAL